MCFHPECTVLQIRKRLYLETGKVSVQTLPLEYYRCVSCRCEIIFGNMLSGCSPFQLFISIAFSSRNLGSKQPYLATQGVQNTVWADRSASNLQGLLIQHYYRIQINLEKSVVFGLSPLNKYGSALAIVRIENIWSHFCSSQRAAVDVRGVIVRNHSL